jgi:acyl dehydratase
VPGRWFEEFEVGQVFDHAQRVSITQHDNALFCRLTRNTQPLHLDEAYARGTEFGGIVVNGLYTFSLAVGVSVEETTSGTLVANLGYEDVRHPAPVRPGDTLRFTTQVVEKRPSSKPGRGIVTLRHQAFNQEGQEVCQFKRVVMVRTEAPA